MVSFPKIGRRRRRVAGWGWGRLFDCIANISTECDQRHQKMVAHTWLGRGQDRMQIQPRHVEYIRSLGARK